MESRKKLGIGQNPEKQILILRINRVSITVAIKQPGRCQREGKIFREGVWLLKVLCKLSRTLNISSVTSKDSSKY